MVRDSHPSYDRSNRGWLVALEIALLLPSCSSLLGYDDVEFHPDAGDAQDGSAGVAGDSGAVGGNGGTGGASGSGGAIDGARGARRARGERVEARREALEERVEARQEARVGRRVRAEARRAPAGARVARPTQALRFRAQRRWPTGSAPRR